MGTGLPEATFPNGAFSQNLPRGAGTDHACQIAMFIWLDIPMPEIFWQARRQWHICRHADRRFRILVESTDCWSVVVHRVTRIDAEGIEGEIRMVPLRYDISAADEQRALSEAQAYIVRVYGIA